MAPITNKPKLNASPINVALDAAAEAGIEPVVLTPANLPDDAIKHDAATTIIAPSHGDAPKTVERAELPPVEPVVNQIHTGSGGKDDSIHEDGELDTDAPSTTAPIIVEAAPTVESIWAEPLLATLIASLDSHWMTRPQNTTWVEPTEAQINEMIASGIRASRLNPMTDFAKIGAIANEVQAQIKKDRASAGADGQAKTDKQYGSALLDLVKGPLVAHVRKLAGFKEPTVKEKIGEVVKPKSDKKDAATPDEPKMNRAARRAAPFIAWAQLNGMEHFIRIDTPSAKGTGIGGTWHARALQADGTYREVIFNDEDGSFTLTDRVIPAGTPNAVFADFDDINKAIDTGSANVRMSVLIYGAAAITTSRGWSTMTLPDVEKDINERAKTAASA